MNASDLTPAPATTRRQLLVLAFASSAGPAASAAWPEKPIPPTVAFPPSGGPDLLTSALADALPGTKGWSIVILNKPGEGGNLGTVEVANATAHGYTVRLGHVGALAVNMTQLKQLTFDPLKDFAPVGILASSPLLVVTGADPF